MLYKVALMPCGKWIVFIAIVFVGPLGFAGELRCLDLFEISAPRTRATLDENTILEMIRYLNTHNLRLNTHALNKDSDGTIQSLLRDRFGYQAKASSLLRVAITKFGSWDRALERAGIDPIQHRHRELSEDIARQALTDLQNLGVDIRNASLVLADARVDAVLTRLRGSPFTAPQFYSLAYRYYGGWRSMLTRLGFRKNDPLSSEFQRKALLDLMKMGVNIEQPMSFTRDPRVTIYLRKHVGVLFGSVSFYNVIKQGGSWKKALNDLKLTDQISNTPSQETLVHIIRSLYAAGFDLTHNSMHMDPGHRILHHLIQKKISHLQPSLIVLRAKQLFGSWDLALRAAGYEPLWIRQRAELRSPEARAVWIHKILEDLKNLNIDLTNPTQWRNDPRVTAYFQAHPQLTQFSSFFSLVRAEYGTWGEALFKLSFTTQLPARPWTAETIVGALQRLQTDGVPLNFRNVMLDPFGEIRMYLLIHEITGSRPERLVLSAREIFGSWDKALIAANINPDNVRLRGTTPYHLLTQWMKEQRATEVGDWLPQQRHTHRDRNGNLTTEIIDPTNLEGDYIARENQQRVDQSIERLSLTEKQLFSEMVREIEIHGLPEVGLESLPRELAIRIVSRNPTTESIDGLAARIQQLMRQLLANEDLRDALLPN